MKRNLKIIKVSIRKSKVTKKKQMEKMIRKTPSNLAQIKIALKTKKKRQRMKRKKTLLYLRMVKSKRSKRERFKLTPVLKMKIKSKLRRRLPRRLRKKQLRFKKSWMNCKRGKMNFKVRS